MDQTGWQWCSKCQGLFWTGAASASVCPTGGTHDGSTSARYTVDAGADPAAHPNGQSGWACCTKCQGLCFGPGVGQSHCPAGSAHDISASADCTLDFESSATPSTDQRGWHWCAACQGLFFSGNSTPGSCPAGGGHNDTGSGSYVVREAVAMAMSLRMSPIMFNNPTLLTNLLPHLPLFTPDQLQAIDSDPSATITDTNGATWCQLNAWVGWPGNSSNATWQCRRNQLTIALPRTVSNPQVLDFSTGFPTASLALPSGTLPLAVALDSDTLRLVATFGPDDAAEAQYDAAIGALSAPAGGVITVSTSHDISIQQPAPPTPIPVPFPRPLPPVPGPPVHFPQRSPIDDPPDRPFPREPLQEKFVMPATIETATTSELTKQIEVADPEPPVIVPGGLLHLRFNPNNFGRVFLEPVPNHPGAVTVSTVQMTATAALTQHAESDQDAFPDVPHPGTTGWMQVTPTGQTTSLHCQPSARPDLFYYLPSAYKLGFHAGDSGTDAPTQPFRVTMASGTDGNVTITASMTAMPYLADADRAALRQYLVDHVLVGQPYVELEAASGLTATFEAEFYSAGVPVAGSSIRYSLVGTTTSEMLEIAFTMDQLDYGLFVPMIEHGITGAIVLTGSDSFSASVPVVLRLDDVITNAVGVDAPLGDASVVPYAGHVTLTNRLTYPITVASLNVDLINVGPDSDIVFHAEEISVVSDPLALTPGSSSSGLTYSPTLSQWTDVLVMPGEISVQGPAPADWINEVNRDPSLQPAKVMTTLSLSIPAADLQFVRAVTATVYATASTTPWQPPLQLTPTNDAVLELDLTLAELAAGVDVHTGFQLEFTTRFIDDTVSLAQRISLDLNQDDYDLLVLYEPPGAQYYIDTDATTGPFTREQAASAISTLRAAGQVWAVRAVLPVATPDPPSAQTTG